MRRDDSGAVRDYSWRRLNLPGAVFEVRSSTRRFRHGGRPVEVTLRPCGSMRYATDNGRPLPLYVVSALEEAATAAGIE